MKRTSLLLALTLATTQTIGCHYQKASSPVVPAQSTTAIEPYNPPPPTAGFPTVAVAEKQLIASPNSPLRHYILGMAYYKEHNFSNAASQFEKAVRVLPASRNVNNLFYLGFSYKALNEPQKALGVYRQILTRKLSQEDASEADCAIANIYNAQNDAVQAKIWYAKAIEQVPHQTSALLGLGNISAIDGKKNEAMHYFQSALKYADTNRSKAQAYAGIGILNEQQSKLDAAMHAYSQALILDRTNLLAKQGIQRLKE